MRYKKVRKKFTAKKKFTPRVENLALQKAAENTEDVYSNFLTVVNGYFEKDKINDNGVIRPITYEDAKEQALFTADTITDEEIKAVNESVENEIKNWYNGNVQHAQERRACEAEFWDLLKELKQTRDADLFIEKYKANYEKSEKIYDTYPF